MKQAFVLSLFIMANAQAAQLDSYQQIVDAVHSGQSIRYVVDWDLCTVSMPDVTPGFSSSYTPDHVVISKQGVLSSRGVTYTHRLHLAPELGPVNQAYVYSLNDKGVLNVINYFLDPITYAEKMKAIEASCILGQAVKVFSIA